NASFPLVSRKSSLLYHVRVRKHRFATITRHTGTAQPPQSPRLSPDGHIPDYFLRFSPVVMPVKVVRCFHDHTGWFNNIRRNILMITPVSLMD
ncbi:hypothetical protein QP292_24610, partial [Escherichia coli]|nr:hypothetical protein [Escherichia coli]